MIDKIVLCGFMALIFIWLMVVMYHLMGIHNISSKKFRVIWVILEVVLGLACWLLVTKFFYANIPERVVNSFDLN